LYVNFSDWQFPQQLEIGDDSLTLVVNADGSPTIEDGKVVYVNDRGK